MANQLTINIGAAANDGTGDPLRTAFNEVNLNFANVWATGLPNSNVQFNNNRILTVNTNANLILAPNGVGVVQSNVSILPNADRVHNLGSSQRKWDSVYAHYLNIDNFDLNGDLTVSGNLTVQGNTIQIGNIITDTKTIQLANTASTANAANGSGITVGANDNIATLLYSSTSNVWATNIGISSVGNVTAPYFFGNGSQLTGLPVQYGNANVVTLLAGFGSNTISTTGNITGGFIFGNISQAIGFPATYGNSNVTTLLSNLGSNIINGTGNITTTANISGGFILGNLAFANGLPATYSNANAVAYGQSGWAGNIIPSGNAVYSLGNATNQWNDLYVSNATIFMNNVPITLGAGNVLTVNGNAVLQNDSNTSISTTGNITSGNINSPTLNNSGNIRIVASGNAWTFDATGNLILPRGSIVYETNIPGGILSGNTIALKPQGGISTDQQLLIYPTVIPGADDNHLHLTTGNLYNTELFLGNDDLYVKLANTGNVVINSNNGVGNSAQWTFGTDGNLTAPGNVSAVGNVTAGNLTVGSGTITGGNVNGSIFNGNVAFGTGTVGGSGNITGGNIISMGVVSATGNVTANIVAATNNGSGTNFKVGDDMWLGDVNVSDTMSLRGQQNAANAYLLFGNVDTTSTLGRSGSGPLTWTGNFSVTGNITGNTAGFAIGYRDIPQVTFNANATTALTDAGKHYYSVSASNLVLTIANNSSVVWPVGTAISIVNRGAGNITVAGGTGVSLYLAGNSTAGNRTVTTYGMATLLNVAANVWMINGSGVS